MKTLCLPLKKEWYEMIESGVKTEEYREIKPYWVTRLAHCYKWCSLNVVNYLDRCIKCSNNENFNKISGMNYTHVKFSYGYTKRTMIFEIDSITIGKGKPEWGAPNEDVFIIKFGKRIKQN